MPKKGLALLLFILLCLSLPKAAYSQGAFDDVDIIDWRELETTYFLIVYAERVYEAGQAIACACGIEQAQRYVDFVDGAYRELADIFGAELNRPISLHLFPTEDSYYAVNPLAENLPGVIAHAANDRQEIAIALSRTEGLSEERVVNNVRHELAHLFASHLSAGALTTGFQEGIAQYLEKPSVEAAYDPAVLRLAMEEGRLLTWKELDEKQEVYGDPQVAYPQTLSIVSFLVDRYGFPDLLGFVKAMAEEPGYRSALEVTYQKPADDLEEEWLAYLPDYFAGRWQINAIYAYDLTRVTVLVDRGAYGDAQAALEEIVALLETTNQDETLAQAEALLARAHRGQTAAALAEDARRALEASDYSEAIENGRAALDAYAALGFQERRAEIQVYIERAGMGQKALDQLSHGEALLEGLRFSDARGELYEATALLQSLNNPVGVRRGEELLAELGRRQRILAYGLMAMSLATILFTSLRRAIRRLHPDVLEVDFT